MSHALLDYQAIKLTTQSAASDSLFAVERRILQLLKLVVFDRFDSSDRE